MDLMAGMRWWSVLIRGIVAIIFGLIALLQPGIALASLILVFGAYALVDGVFAIAAGLRAPGSANWFLVIVGVVGVLAGIYAFVSPGLTALALLTLIGVWAVFTGVMEIIAAWRMRQVIENEFWLALSGIVSVIFGAYVLAFPGEGALAVIWIVGIWAIVAGVIYVLLSLRLRGVENRLTSAFTS